MEKSKKPYIRPSIESERIELPQAWACSSTAPIWGESGYYTYGFISDMHC